MHTGQHGPAQAGSTGGQLQRRGLMACLAALVAGGLAKLSGAERVQAADGQALVLGSTANQATGETVLTRGSGTPSASNYALHVFGSSGSAGIFGDSSHDGVHGYTSDTTDQYSGAVGIAGFGGNKIYITAGVHGSCVNYPGVIGDSNNSSGVIGLQGGNVTAPPGYFAGVFGVAPTGIHAVQGVAGGVGPLPPVGTVGVGGYSGTGIGAVGTSTSNHGVFGLTTAPAGTVQSGLLAAGCVGRATGTVALYGYANGGPNPSAPPYGAIGQCESGFGFWGLSNAPAGAIARPGGGVFTAVSGVLGTSPNNVGVYAISTGNYALVADGNGPATVGALIRGNGGAQAAVFMGNVQIQGNLHVSGSIGPTPPPAGASAPASTASALRGVESPEALVEAVGEGQLVASRAEVRLDPALAASLQDGRYQVFLTEYEDHAALFVTRRTAQGFEVRAKDSPTAASAFSYRVIGRRRDAEGARAAAAEPLHTPAIPAGQGVPTLPAVRDVPPPERGSNRN